VLTLTATTPGQLRAVAGEIHDHWFDLDDVSFDAQAREVLIAFRRFEREERRELARSGRPLLGRLLRATSVVSVEAPWHRWWLRIGQATSCDIVDEDRVAGGTAEVLGPARMTAGVEDGRVHPLTAR
jgi:hypothetical protein